jgi:DNA modification methylase
VEYLIRTYTNPGDVVLDPTAGSMTTAIACLNTGRGYICIEKDPDEYLKGLARVEEHLAKPVQFNLLEPTPDLPTVATMHQTSLWESA